MADDNPKLIRLEENLFFLEKKVEQLDEQILLQQQDMGRLESEMAEMRSLLLRMKDTDEKKLRDGRQNSPEIPPHYQSTVWHDD